MRVLLVMLGACEFPRRSDLSSPAFAKSHTALRAWLLENAHGPFVVAEDFLNLFDSPLSWPDQEATLADWLEHRTSTQPVPTDLIVHYVGHGGFRDESRDYYLAIRATRAENPFYSSIIVDSLWRTLRGGARRLRRFLIIDACFAAAAVRALMAPLQEVVKVKVRDLQDAEGAQAAREEVPDRGTAVLCSSSAQNPASMAGTGGVTQFTDGLIQVLGAGSEAVNDRLSLAQVHALVKASLSARYKENAVTPELHAPDQRLGLSQDVPIFPNVQLTSVKPTLAKASTLAELGRVNEAIAIYDDLIARSGKAELPLREQAAIALARKGVMLGTLGRNEEAIAVYDDLLARFSDATEAVIREQVARALLHKGDYFKSLGVHYSGYYEDAIAAYDDLIARFGTASEPAIREQVAEALYNKGEALCYDNLEETSIPVYNDLLSRFRFASEPKLREWAAKAQSALEPLNRAKDVIAVYDELIGRLGTAREPALREQVARALLNKGGCLDRFYRNKEAIVVYDELIARFGTDREPALREQVARAFLNKGDSFYSWGNNLAWSAGPFWDAIAAYDDLIARFGTASEPAIREQVAEALYNKTGALSAVAPAKESIPVYNELIARFGTASEPAIRQWVAKAKSSLKNLQKS